VSEEIARDRSAALALLHEWVRGDGLRRHALAVEGPIREYYVIGQRDTADVALWRTEVCWPVFRVGG